MKHKILFTVSILASVVAIAGCVLGWVQPKQQFLDMLAFDPRDHILMNQVTFCVLSGLSIFSAYFAVAKVGLMKYVRFHILLAAICVISSITVYGLLADIKFYITFLTTYWMSVSATAISFAIAAYTFILNKGFARG